MPTWTLIAAVLLLGGGPKESSEGAVHANGDANGDATIDLTDAIYLLKHLFWSGPAPVRYTCVPCDACCPEAYRTLSTGVTQCIDPVTRLFLQECPEEGEPGYGQDGTYQAGVSRRGQYVVVPLGEEDNKQWITVDYATGLMWQYRAFTLDCEGLEQGPFDDWRMPNILELVSLFRFPLREYQAPQWPDHEGFTLWAAMDPESFFLLGDETGRISMRYSSSTLELPGVNAVYCPHYDWGIFSAGAAPNVRCVRIIEDGDLELLGLPHLRSQVAAPLENGDANGDRTLDITDAVHLLQHLFLGGPRPVDVVCPGCDTCCGDFPGRPLKTGMDKCFDGPFRIPCDRHEALWQDGHYQAGIGREFWIASSGSADPAEWMTVDLATGLLWQYASSSEQMSWQEALDHCEALELGGFEDWRLPNFFEFMTLVNFGESEPSATYFEYFAWPEPRPLPHWTSTPIADETQGPFGREALFIGVSMEQDAGMPIGGVSTILHVRAVRTLRPGDLEMLGLR